AVIMMTQQMAAELAQHNVQVNAIAPGFIKTAFSSAIWQNESVNKQVTAQIPQHRIAEPKELTGMALYLAAEASSFTTGAVMLVDGGQKISVGI
ncbi:MAG: SDR family oxidoreductase, partial [Chloroflexota bacterium]